MVIWTAIVGLRPVEGYRDPKPAEGCPGAAVAIEVVSSGAEAEPAPAQVFEVFAPDAGSFLAADSV
jgi:hypothetical protein